MFEKEAEEYADWFWGASPSERRAIKQAYLAGLKAGKGMTDEELAEGWVTDNTGFNPKEPLGKIAIRTFLGGLKAGRPKWHRISDGDLPKENKLYLVEIKDNGLAIAYFDGLLWETRYNLGDSGHCVETVIAWCKIPTFTDKE